MKRTVHQSLKQAIARKRGVCPQLGAAPQQDTGASGSFPTLRFHAANRVHPGGQAPALDKGQPLFRQAPYATPSRNKPHRIPEGQAPALGKGQPLPGKLPTLHLRATNYVASRGDRLLLSARDRPLPAGSRCYAFMRQTAPHPGGQPPAHRKAVIARSVTTKQPAGYRLLGNSRKQKEDGNYAE
jgi:hypothetical protein